MLTTIRQFFERNIRPRHGGGEEDEQRRLKIATAALLIEMMRMDEEIKESERDAVAAAIRGKFHLGSEETQALVRLAETEAGQATDYHQFTSLINKGYTPEQKEKVIEYMWQVAYADGELDKYERHLVQKIADLLYVPHAAMIAAKHRAMRAHGGAHP